MWSLSNDKMYFWSGLHRQDRTIRTTVSSEIMVGHLQYELYMFMCLPATCESVHIGEGYTHGAV